MADVALNAARSKGASYADVRIGRYLNQFISAREKRVDNVVNAESYGLGVRVIVNGCWGFAATDNLTTDNIAKTAGIAVQIAKANSKLMDEPVKLAPQKGYGEVSGKRRSKKMLLRSLLKIRSTCYYQSTMQRSQTAPVL
jgi:TldD protein